MGIKDWFSPKKETEKQVVVEPEEKPEEKKPVETPEQIEARKRYEEKQNRAELIIKYEDMVKRRDALVTELTRDADNLETFADVVRQSYGGNRFEKRHNHETPEKTLAFFNPNRIDEYWEIKKKAVECEKLFFELFTLRQKLKLHGIDESLKEDD